MSIETILIMIVFPFLGAISKLVWDSYKMNLEIYNYLFNKDGKSRLYTKKQIDETIKKRDKIIQVHDKKISIIEEQISNEINPNIKIILERLENEN